EGFCTSVGIMERGRLIRSGRIEEMISSEAARKVQLRWLGNNREGAQVVLRGQLGVSSVELNSNEGQFAFSGTDEELSGVLEALIASGIRVVGFQEAKRTFEEMYMKVSSHEVM